MPERTRKVFPSQIAVLAALHRSGDGSTPEELGRALGIGIDDPQFARVVVDPINRMGLVSNAVGRLSFTPLGERIASDLVLVFDSIDNAFGAAAHRQPRTSENGGAFHVEDPSVTNRIVEQYKAKGQYVTHYRLFSRAPTYVSTPYALIVDSNNFVYDYWSTGVGERVGDPNEGLLSALRLLNPAHRASLRWQLDEYREVHRDGQMPHGALDADMLNAMAYFGSSGEVRLYISKPGLFTVLGTDRAFWTTRGSYMRIVDETLKFPSAEKRMDKDLEAMDRALESDAWKQ